MKKVIIVAAVIMCLAVLFYAWGEVRCRWCDGPMLRVPKELVDFIESVEVQWRLKEGYAGRMYAAAAAREQISGYSMELGLSAIIDDKTVGQYGSRRVEPHGRKWPWPANWSDSGSIREAVEAGKDPVLMGAIRIYDADGEVVYHGYDLSEPLSVARQR